MLLLAFVSAVIGGILGVGFGSHYGFMGGVGGGIIGVVLGALGGWLLSEAIDSFGRKVTDRIPPAKRNQFGMMLVVVLILLTYGGIHLFGHLMRLAFKGLISQS